MDSLANRPVAEIDIVNYTKRGYPLPHPAMYRILVKIDTPPEKIGSLFVAQQVKDKAKIDSENATVVAVGRSAWNAYDDGKQEAKVGDHVMFVKFGGVQIDPMLVGGDDSYRILNDKDILAIWPDKTEKPKE